MAAIDDLYIRILADGSQLDRGLDQAQGSLDNFGTKIQGIGQTLIQAFSVWELKNFVVGAIEAFDESQRAQAKVAQALQVTAGVAGKSFEYLQSKAEGFQKSTLFEDDSIMNNVTAQLLTFTNISGDAFDRAQVAALDLATVLDSDLKGVSIQLGKALNDPVQGLTALRRSGISFSSDQVAVIKNLSETNRLAEAQSMILAEVERQYGGQAEAAAKASAGLQQFKNELSDSYERIGGNIAKGGMLKDMLDDVVGIADAWSRVNSFDTFTSAFDVTIFGGSKALMDARINAEGLAKEMAKIPMTGMFNLTAGPLDTGAGKAPVKEEDTYGKLKEDLKGYQDDLEHATKSQMAGILANIEAKKEEIKKWEELGNASKKYEGSIKALQEELDNLNKSRDTATGAGEVAAINDRIRKKEEEINILKNATAEWLAYGQTIGKTMAEMQGAKMSPLDEKLNSKDTWGKAKNEDMLKSNKGINDKPLENAKKQLIDAKKLSDEINGTIAGGFTNMVSSMTEAAATGGNVGAAMLGTFGGMLSQLGQMLVKEGMGILAAKIALKSLNPGVAIAAGVGLIAIGSMFSKGAKSLADGGGGSAGGSGAGYGSTGSGAGTYDTRQNQTSFPKEITLKVEGRDLVGAISANSLYYDRKG